MNNAERQLYDNIRECDHLPECGDRYNDKIGRVNRLAPYRVMGIIDKWVMMRRKRCRPTVAHVNSFGLGKQYEVHHDA